MNKTIYVISPIIPINSGYAGVANDAHRNYTMAFSDNAKAEEIVSEAKNLLCAPMALTLDKVPDYYNLRATYWLVTLSKDSGDVETIAKDDRTMEDKIIRAFTTFKHNSNRCVRVPHSRDSLVIFSVISDTFEEAASWAKREWSKLYGTPMSRLVTK